MFWLDIILWSIGLVGAMGVCWTFSTAIIKERRKKVEKDPTTITRATIYGASTIGKPKATYGSDPTKVSTTEIIATQTRDD